MVPQDKAGLAAADRGQIQMANILALIVFFVLAFCAAATGGVYSPDTWYESLNKPSWTPANWVFPTVWAVLYTMIAIAGWRVWKVEGVSAALMVWGIGLVINGFWSYFMFGRHDIGLALVDVSLLWVATAAFIVLSWNVDRAASVLFMPYIVWVSTATLLNYQVWQLNRGI